MDGTIGDDPQALAAEYPLSETTPSAPRRTTGNFNVIFEITPASLSTTDSIRREDQRVNSRQVTDEALIVPIESPRESATSETAIHLGIRTFLRGPYKLNNTFQEPKLLTLLAYPVLILFGHGLSSLPLIPLCSYLLRRKTVALRERSPSVETRKLLISWQVERIEDVTWLMEMLEPLHDYPSLIQLEVSVHIDPCPSKLFPARGWMQCLEHVIHEPHQQKMPLDSRMVLHFGKRDCVYQLEKLKHSVEERVGIVVDGPHSTSRRICDWIRANSEDPFDFLSFGIVSI